MTGGAGLRNADAATRPSPRALECTLVQAEHGTAFDEWREINGRIAAVSLGTAPADTFHAHLSIRHLGRSLVLQTRSVAQVMTRNRAWVRQSGIDHIAIKALHAGHAVGEFQGHLLEVAAGDVLCIDYSREFECRTTDFFDTTLVVPRRYLPQQLRSVRLHGLVLSGDKAATRLLDAHMRALAEQAAELSPEEAVAGVEAAFILVQGAKGGEDPLRAPAARDGGQVLLREILNFIDSHLKSESLGYETIMGRFKVSKSTLYRLFDDIGGVNSYVVNRRLDACYDDFARDGSGAALIGQIAFSYGFMSQAHFSRLFKKRFGVSPRHVRGVALNVADPLVEVVTSRSRMADAINDWLRFAES